MGLADKFKKENILIQQEDSHNKFWAAQMDAKTFKVSIRWGRLGTKGQSQEKDFEREYAAADFIATKMREKTRKGYTPIDKPKFDQLCIQAAIVGTSNKCHSFNWVEIKDDNKFVFIKEEQLADPNCNPGIYVELETKKEYDGQNNFRLVFTFDKMYVIPNGGSSLRAAGLVIKGSPLYELSTKVEEAIGRTLSA